MADLREVRQRGLLPEHEVGQRPSGEVRRRDTVADVAAGPADPGLRVQPDGGVPVARDPERTTPASGDLGVGRVREEVEQRAAKVGEHLGVLVDVRTGAGPAMVGGAMTAERETVVGRPLAVDDQVTMVGERLAAGQPDLVPDLGG